MLNLPFQHFLLTKNENFITRVASRYITMVIDEGLWPNDVFEEGAVALTPCTLALQSTFGRCFPSRQRNLGTYNLERLKFPKPQESGINFPEK
jgi:hypothetical protein